MGQILARGLLDQHNLQKTLLYLGKADQLSLLRLFEQHVQRGLELMLREDHFPLDFVQQTQNEVDLQSLPKLLDAVESRNDHLLVGLPCLRDL